MFDAGKRPCPACRAPPALGIPCAGMPIPVPSREAFRSAGSALELIVRRRMRGVYHAHHTEADVGVADIRVGAAAPPERGSVAAVAPGKAAEDAIALRSAAQPFADVAVHVVGPDAAGRVAPDRGGLRGAVAARVTIIVEFALPARIVHVATRTRAAVAAAARGAQPLALAGQAIG